VKKANSGVFGWNKGLINLFMTAQVEASAALACLLTERNLFKINYTAPHGMLSLDDASRVSELVGLGRAEAVKVANMEMVKDRFLNGRHAPRFMPAVDAVRSSIMFLGLKPAYMAAPNPIDRCAPI
jgi:hypothetical protein